MLLLIGDVKDDFSFRNGDSLKRPAECVKYIRARLQVHGSMLPNELIRPKSYAYHNFELEGYVRLALQAEQLGIDLWNFQASKYNSVLVRPFSLHFFTLRLRATTHFSKSCGES
jgi:Alginate lyase